VKRALKDEDAVLDGQLLKLSFQATVPCFACEVSNAAGVRVKTIALLPRGQGYVCSIDLGALEPGSYSIAVRSGDATVLFGSTIASRRAKRPADGGTNGSVVAVSALAAPSPAKYARLLSERATGGLSLVLSSDDLVSPGRAQESRALPANRFSVIAAVFNVEKYLDQFFRSLVEQSLDFESHIEVIAVDDGSSDGSASIVRSWQSRFPDNIHYFRKENGGPASARNVGLEAAQHEWVTFCDPDDFVDRNYFAEVDAAIRKRDHDLVMISCNHTVYDEASNSTIDTHPLRYRFADGEKAVESRSLGRYLQLNTNSAFVRRSVIAGVGLAFDSRVRPGFEDAHFIGRYLLAAPEGVVLFLPRARYLYRKRSDSTSLTDRFETNPEWYGDHLRYGYLGLMNAARATLGFVPRQVQDTVLYSVLWKFGHVVDRPEAVAFLGEERRRQFLDLLTEVFKAIDVATILEYRITPMPFSWRAGILNLFKDAEPPSQRAEVTDLDRRRSEARIVYWTRSQSSSATFIAGGRSVAPAFTKVRRRDFAGRPFIWEHINWVPVASGALEVMIDGRPATIAAGRKDFAGAAEFTALGAAMASPVMPDQKMPEEVRMLRHVARSAKATTDFRDAWVFIDRDTEADDNAEHLYRYVRQQRPDINIFFVIERNVPHWNRLAADGFRLLAFNEPEHVLAVLNAAHLISSQADHYVTGYSDPRYFGDVVRYRFTYLRHGISKDDTSAWLNEKRIDCLIATTPAEFDSIVADGSPYKFTRKEVVLTGLPRHDALLRGNSTERRFVVVMPTWRSSLTGPALGPGNARSVNPAFHASEFARRWSNFLNSPRLAALEAGGYESVFVPHPNLEHYLAGLAMPQRVAVRRFSDGRPINGIFQKCAVFVTDYSSKAFDLALLGKPVVYYQFDRESFFGGAHMGGKGYYDYDRDGFGPVLTDEAAVFDAIEHALTNGVSSIYQERALTTFPFRDGRNCARVLDAILALDTPHRVSSAVSA
jgi:glycosyltransferase involved in cell wall biosynthesis